MKEVYKIIYQIGEDHYELVVVANDFSHINRKVKRHVELRHEAKAFFITSLERISDGTSNVA